MGTIKKSDFKMAIKEGKSIEEFVDVDGGIISGDERYNKGTEIKTGPINQPDDEGGIATTTDDFAATSIQPRNWWWSLSYGYGQGKGKSPIGSNMGIGPNDSNLDESVDESELTKEQMMKKMVEDILSRKSSNKDLVKKSENSDVNRGNIPDISTIEETKMIVVGKTKDLLDSIKDSNLNGEELATVLNYILYNTDTSSIPSEYKPILRKLI